MLEQTSYLQAIRVTGATGCQPLERFARTQKPASPVQSTLTPMPAFALPGKPYCACSIISRKSVIFDSQQTYRLSGRDDDRDRRTWTRRARIHCGDGKQLHAMVRGMSFSRVRRHYPINMSAGRSRHRMALGVRRRPPAPHLPLRPAACTDQECFRNCPRCLTCLFTLRPIRFLRLLLQLRLLLRLRQR